jgi:heat shock protein HtpX
VTAVDDPGRCPRCDSTALARVRTDPPWCTACEWNLDAWPEPKVKRHRRRVLRNRRRAFEINRRLLRDLEGAHPARPRATRADVIMGAASAGLVLFDLALIVFGAVLLVTAAWPLKVVALIMILVGLECRIRFFRIDTFGSTTRAELPELWSLVDGARAAVGAPRIDVLTINNEFNASCARSGIRRRTVLSIGMPLWGALSPAGRQALLGHELGHLVNGDPTTAFATQPALTTFARLAEIFDPEYLIDADDPIRQLIGTIIAYTLFWPLRVFCTWAHFGLARVAAQDHQRAEAYADALAVRLGGTDGAVELMQVLLFYRTSLTALRRAAGDSDHPPAWQGEVARSIAVRTERLAVAEQTSMRYDVSVYASHPPTGLRSRLVRSWPATQPAIRVPVDVMAAADRALQRKYRIAQRAITVGSVR